MNMCFPESFVELRCSESHDFIYVGRYKIGDLGVKQAEPRLEPKKHRRQSRKKINQSVLQELDELDDDNLSDDDNNDPILRAMKNEHQ